MRGRCFEKKHERAAEAGAGRHAWQDDGSGGGTRRGGQETAPAHSVQACGLIATPAPAAAVACMNRRLDHVVIWPPLAPAQ